MHATILMEQYGNITIVESESRFKKVDKSLIENPNIDCLTLGIYTKLIVLGKKWELNVNGLRKYLGLSDDKVRKSLSLLEREGYILRTPARNEKGQMKGWNYTIYPTPINEAERSQAGKKDAENRPHEKPSTPKTDHTDNGGLSNNRLNETLDLIELKPKKNNIDIRKKFNFKQALLDLGVDEKIVDDWLLVRKNKKATNSETAFNAIKKQIELSGVSANDCITLSVEHSWAGFKAEWYNNEHSNDATLFNSNNVINATSDWQTI